MAGDEAPARVTIEGSIATIAFARPHAANAIDIPTARAFRDGLSALVGDDRVRALVVRGDSRFFCAGGDVAGMLADADPSAFLAELAGTFHEAVELLAEAPFPVVAAVEGVAAGAGLSVVAAADVVVATPAATFLSAYLDVGLTPDSGLSWRLPRLVGDHRARELVLLGRRLDAATAHDWGIVTEVVEPAVFDERVAVIAARLAGLARPAVAEARRLLLASWDRSMPDQLADEADTISRVVSGDDAQQRLRDFAARAAERSSR